jgi:hypothetical protein
MTIAANVVNELIANGTSLASVNKAIVVIGAAMVQKINVLNFMWHPFRLRRRSAKALRGLGVVLPAGCGARRQSSGKQNRVTLHRNPGMT